MGEEIIRQWCLTYLIPGFNPSFHAVAEAWERVGAALKHFSLNLM